ncbi:antigenic thaumatin domain-containing protein [Stemphylium lycopersici]|nr:antigenic thaumatin domain-containing protein [Stemphylium lycopersici]
MQLTTLFSMASAIAATASADYGAKNDRSAVKENEICDLSKPHARVINRCDYDVYLWSVYQGLGCPETGMVTLKTGEVYAENYVDSANTKTATSPGVGVSIKISKTQECKGNDITQLEYFINNSTEDGGYRKRDENDYNFNYLDVSYVDCQGMDCPARKDGYYLVAGNQTGGAKASADNTWCPILSCTDADSCDKMSYVLPDDVQTKTCYTSSSIDFYMCGGEAPDGEYDSAPKPDSSSEYSAPSYSSSTKLAEYPTAESTPAASSSSSSEEVAYSADIEVSAAAITPTPQKQDGYGNDKLTKTKVVYVTAYEYVNEKRHAHDHAHRHAAFHA